MTPRKSYSTSPRLILQRSGRPRQKELTNEPTLAALHLQHLRPRDRPDLSVGDPMGTVVRKLTRSGDAIPSRGKGGRDFFCDLSRCIQRAIYLRNGIKKQIVFFPLSK